MSPIEIRGLISHSTQRVRNPIPRTARHGMCFYETGGELVCSSVSCLRAATKLGLSQQQRNMELL